MLIADQAAFYSKKASGIISRIVPKARPIYKRLTLSASISNVHQKKGYIGLWCMKWNWSIVEHVATIDMLYIGSIRNITPACSLFSRFYLSTWSEATILLWFCAKKVNQESYKRAFWPRVKLMFIVVTLLIFKPLC